MKHPLIVLVLVVVWQVCAIPARAGLYNTAEPEPEVGPLVEFPKFRASLDALRNIARVDPPETTERKRYLLAALIDPRGRGAVLTPEQRVNLGAYLIRLGKYAEAIEILRPVEASRNFMALANLATAYQYTGLPERATG